MADQQQSQQTLSPSSDQNSSSHMWDGEEMCVHISLLSIVSSPQRPSQRFNVYIYDYCTKRGYNKTARCLEEEACIPQDNRRPPIDAKQGLLYEQVPPFLILFIYHLIILMSFFLLLHADGGRYFGCCSQQRRTVEVLMMLSFISR